MENENLDESNNKNVSLSLLADYGASDSDSEGTEEAASLDNMLNDDSEESLEMSEMVMKNNMINACAHGPLSGNSSKDPATTRHMIIDSVESGVVEYDVSYRNVDTSDSESSSFSDSSESDVDSVKDVEELSSSEENEAGGGKIEPPKVKGELDLNDLPPIEDLAISLPAEETTKIGTITSIVDKLVIIRALPETPAVNLDSVLFLDKGARALGKVFDVFGPVTEPHYCVRFNSVSHVRERGADVGADVYIAPNHSDHTNYVFLSELMKVKGSDASWLHDVEPPPTQVEYSDDEEERRAKRQQKQKPEAQGSTDDRPPNRKPERRNQNQRPSDSSSRFGSGPSRGRNPFSAGSRRNPNTFPRYTRPWPDLRTPPTDMFTLPPPGFPMFPPPFNPTTPPPNFQFGAAPRFPPHFAPVFPPYRGAQATPPWVNEPPPPPGT